MRTRGFIHLGISYGFDLRIVRFVNKDMKPAWIFATLGYPGSGKTYFAEQWCGDFNFLHLNSDRTRIEIFEQPKHTPFEHRATFNVMNYMAEEALSRGVSVVYDTNSAKRVHRERLRQLAARHGARYLLLWFQTPLELALTRIQTRGSTPEEQAKKFYQPVDPEHLYRIRGKEEFPEEDEPHVILSGEDHYEVQKTRVLSKIEEKR